MKVLQVCRSSVSGICLSSSRQKPMKWVYLESRSSVIVLVPSKPDNPSFSVLLNQLKTLWLIKLFWM